MAGAVNAAGQAFHRESIMFHGYTAGAGDPQNYTDLVIIAVGAPMAADTMPRTANNSPEPIVRSLYWRWLARKPVTDAGQDTRGDRKTAEYRTR